MRSLARRRSSQGSSPRFLNAQFPNLLRINAGEVQARRPARLGNGDQQDGGLAPGAAGDAQGRAAGDGLSGPGAVRVVARRDGHQRGHPQPHAPAAEEGKPARALAALRRGGPGEVRAPLQDGHDRAVRRVQPRVERERGRWLGAGSAAEEDEGRGLQGLLSGG